MFTQADAREYARLVRELDDRSLSRARRLLFGAGRPGCGCAANARHDRVEGEACASEARGGCRAPPGARVAATADEWRPPRVEAVRAARRCGDGLEFLVREQGALDDEWWAEARLNEYERAARARWGYGRRAADGRDAAGAGGAGAAELQRVVATHTWHQACV